MIQEAKAGKLNGIFLMALFACASFYIGEWNFFREISFSPMIIGIILGMIYANTLRMNLPATWTPGIQYCSKRILRLGIILYGFRLTLQNVADVGLAAIVIDTIIVTVTILGGVWIGRLLKMDRETALLTSIGSGICGAAAVLGAEATMRTKPYKTAVAVATVVIFGTLLMFLYPVAYRTGILELTPEQMGIYSEIADISIIVKMIRVMTLVPVLLILSWWIAARAKRSAGAGADGKKGKVAVPWFAIGFLAVIGFNSLDLIPGVVVEWINQFDTFLLTMAMAALGAETSFDKFKKAGAKPFLLAGILCVWLISGGYLLARYVTPLFN